MTKWAAPVPKSVETFPLAACTANVQLFGASSSNWSFNGVIFTPSEDIGITTSSTMTTLITQTSSGNFILALYKVVFGGNHTRVAYTASTALPAAGYLTPVAFSNIDVSTLTGGAEYLMGIWYGANSPSLAGVPATSNTNIKPYIGMVWSNQGTVTTPPSTITDASTNEYGRPYLKLVV